jgi:hypothetical protein
MTLLAFFKLICMHFLHTKYLYALNRMQEWPLKSKLDPKIYGLQESAISTEMIEREIKGLMTVEEVTISIM